MFNVEKLCRGRTKLEDLSEPNLITLILMFVRSIIDVIHDAFNHYNDFVNFCCELSSAANISANGDGRFDAPNADSRYYQTLYGPEHWLFVLIFWTLFAISFSFKSISCLWQWKKRKDLFEYKTWIDDFSQAGVEVSKERLKELLRNDLKQYGCVLYVLSDKADHINFEQKERLKELLRDALKQRGYELDEADINFKQNGRLKELLHDALKQCGYELDEADINFEPVNVEFKQHKLPISASVMNGQKNGKFFPDQKADKNLLAWEVLDQKMMHHPIFYGIGFIWELMMSYMTLFWAFYFFASIVFSSVFLSTGCLWPILLAAAAVLLCYQGLRFFLSKKTAKNQVDYNQKPKFLLNLKQDISDRLILEKTNAEIKSIFSSLMAQHSLIAQQSCQLEGQACETQALNSVKKDISQIFVGKSIFQNLQKSNRSSRIVQRLRQPLFVRYFLASCIIEVTVSVICGATGVWIASIFFNAIGLASVASIVGGPVGLGVLILLIASCLLFRHLIKRLSEERAYAKQLNGQLNTKVSALPILEEQKIEEQKIYATQLKQLSITVSALPKEIQLNFKSIARLSEGVNDLAFEAALCALEELYVELDQYSGYFIQEIDGEINRWPTFVNQRERSVWESLKEKMQELNEQHTQKAFIKLFSPAVPKSRWQRVLCFMKLLPNVAINCLAGISMGLCPSRVLLLDTGLGLANLFKSFAVLTLLFVSLPFLLLLGLAKVVMFYASLRQRDNQMLIDNLPRETARLISACEEKSNVLSQLIRYHKLIQCHNQYRERIVEDEVSVKVSVKEKVLEQQDLLPQGRVFA